jgi:hypothetical protein
MTNAEAARYARDKPLHCPKETCDGHVTQMGLSPGHKECCKCGRRWEFVDARGQSVSRQEYDALVLAREKKRVERSLPPSIGMEDVMAAKKTKKAARKTSAKKAPAKSAKEPDALNWGPDGLEFVVKYKDKELSTKITAKGFVAAGKTFTHIRDLGEHVTGKRWRDCIIAGIKRALEVKTSKPAAKKTGAKKVAKKKTAKK